MSPTIAKGLLISSLLVLSIWFSLGFLIPLILGLPESGLFGDTFGSVNALFSGFGFIALAYTIFLQLEESKKQKQQHSFEVLLKLHDEIKRDLENFGVKDVRGVLFVDYLKRVIRDESNRIKSKELDRHFNYLFCVIQQILDLSSHTNKFFKADEVEREILAFKIKIIYLLYFNELVVIVQNKEYDNAIFSLFKEETVKLTHRIWDKETAAQIIHPETIMRA